MWKRILLGTVIIVVGVAIIAIKNGLWEPFKEIPEIAQGLPEGEEAASEEFNKRIQEKFGKVPNVVELVGNLVAEGFTIEPTGNIAVFSKASVPCMDQWLVAWSALEGKIVMMQGKYRELCITSQDVAAWRLDQEKQGAANQEANPDANQGEGAGQPEQQGQDKQ